MRELFKSVVCLAAVGVSVVSGVVEAADARRPNIVLIITDDQGYGDCSAYGHRSADVSTPNMDAIARGGVLFNQAYVTAPVCSPSRAGILTGRYQQRFNKEAGWRIGLPERATTIAEHLRGLGYATMMVGKNDFGMHLPSKEDRRYPINHGYDRHLGFESHAHDYFLMTREIEQKAEQPHGPSANVGPLDVDGGEQDFPGAYTTDLFTDTAIAFAKKSVEAKKPFFVTVSYNAVHDIVAQVPEKYLAKFGVKPIPLYDPSMGSYLKYYHLYNTVGAAVNETDMRKYFLANLACLDDNVGRVMGALDEMGVAEDTVVVLLADNGAAVNSGATTGPLRGSKQTTFEGGLRVPMMMRWPGRVKGGQVVEEPVITLDLLPTLVEAAGGTVKAEEEVDGVSLLGRVTTGEAVPARTFYWKFREQWAVRRGDWKLSGSRQVKGKFGDVSWLRRGPLSEEPQLFNLKEDLAEQKDLSKERPEVVKELMEAYQKWEGRHGEWGYGEPGKY